MPSPKPGSKRRKRPPRALHHSARFQIGVTLLVITGFAVLISRLDLHPNLSHLDVAVLSGDARGNYHAIVDKLAALAASRKGRIRNIASQGSVDNFVRLTQAASSCDVHFGLIQGGLDGALASSPANPHDLSRLQLIGRLAKFESIFLLGKKADTIKDFASLEKLRIGIGPIGSGANRIARQVFGARPFASLEIRLSNHTLEEQLELTTQGELDLGLFVMDEDARFIEQAVRDRGLQIAGFPNADVVARKFPFLRVGRIGAGQYEPVKLLPPQDKRVLRVETLVLGNKCASRSQTIAFLSVLAEQFPDFIAHNKDTGNFRGFPLARTAKSFFAQGGPEVADEYVPWAVDIMPFSNWVYVVMGISVLFNVMGFVHRFRLWRIDAARVKAEQDLTNVFGAGLTIGDISRLEPEGALASEKTAERLDALIEELEDLAVRVRRHSLSIMAPMGQEMAYRYQEGVIYKTLAVLRAFRGRQEEAHARASAAASSSKPGGLASA